MTGWAGDAADNDEGLEHDDGGKAHGREGADIGLGSSRRHDAANGEAQVQQQHARCAYLVVSIGLAAIAAVALYGIMGHVRTRVEIWLDPFAYAQEGGFQLVQSLFSIADGDLFAR